MTVVIFAVLIVLAVISSAFEKRKVSANNAGVTGEAAHSRELWLDVLKVLSAPLIVMLHTVGSGYSGAPLNSGTWWGYLFLNILSRCAVPIFIMVSGALLLGKPMPIEKAWRKAKRAIVLLVVWNLVYIFAQAALWGPAEPIWKQILSLPVKRGPSGHLWYAYFLVWLYLFAPIVSALYQTLSERGRLYFVLLSVVVPGVLDLFIKLFDISTSAPLPSFSLYMALAYMGMMFIGRMIREKAAAWPPMRGYSALAAAGGFVGMLAVTYFYCKAHGTATDKFMEETQLLAVCYGAGVVGLVASFQKALNSWPAKVRRLIEGVSMLSIGIYFIHSLFSWTIGDIDIGSFHIARADQPIEALVLGGVYYLLAVFASWLLSKLPGLRVLVTMEGRADMKRDGRNDAARTAEHGQPGLPKKKWILIIFAVIALVYVALRFVPLGERTVTLTGLDKLSDIGKGSEIWIKSIVIDGEEYAPEKVFSEGWIEEEGYLKWRNYDRPEGMTDTISATFPAGTDVDIRFQTNKWRGIVRLKDGYVIPGIYDVDCWSDTESGDDLVSYQDSRIAPGIIRAIRVVLVYAVIAAVVLRIRAEAKKRKDRKKTSGGTPPTGGTPAAVTGISGAEEKAKPQKPEKRKDDSKKVERRGGASRELWLDVLKVLSAPLIVLIHTVGAGYSSAPLDSGSWLGYLFLNTLPRCAVPIFIMVSGALLLGKPMPMEKAWRKAKMALVLLVVWNLAYIFAQAALWGPAEPIWKQILSLPVQRGPSGHLWYAYFLVWLYLLAPVISALYQTLSERGRLYFVLLSVVVPGALDLYAKITGVNGGNILPEFSQYMTLPYMGMMFIGRIIREKAGSFEKMRSYSLLSLLLGFGGMVAATYILSMKNGSATESFLSEAQLFSVFYGAGVVGLTASFRKELDGWSGKVRRIFEEISKLSLGIYFVHSLFMWVVGDIDIGTHHIAMADRPIEALLLAGLYYLLGLFAAWLIAQIPVLRALVTMEGRAGVEGRS